MVAPAFTIFINHTHVAWAELWSGGSMDSSSDAPLLAARWEEPGSTSRRWCREAAQLAGLAAPMVVVMLLQVTMQFISTVMVGHLGDVALAGAAIANSLTNVSGFSVLIGLAGGLETLCGQAYGAEQYHTLSLCTYRSIIALLVVSVPISIVWCFIPEVLPLMGQEPQIANEAGKYALWLIPGLFAFGVTQCFSKFLQCQSLIFPMVLSSLITIAVFLPLCWFMVYKVGMGNAGAALSVSICDWVEVTVLGLYIKFSPSCEKTRAPPSWEAFRGIGSFMRLAVPSALMICLEWWSYELLVLLSGMLPNPALETSVLSICVSTMILLANLPYGIGIATSVRISNELGAGNTQGPRLVVCVALSIVVCSAFLVSTTLLLLRHFIGIAFSKEEEVRRYVTRMVPLLSISAITDSLMAVLQGVSRGCGWQHLGAYVNLGAFYLVGIPVALYFGFAMQLRAKGFWIGILAGGATQVTLLSVITATTNWNKMADKAKERVFEDRLPTQ
ncbi:protein DETOXIFICATION 12 [Aegilops tauschii subsp. strangulata]|uniref:Protein DETOXIFICATION n=1 Tax=Aegilops tauschii subsp. strangulata TaxID=200361 RepID=A0A452XJ07_AEGTS|nr:protein DETOXIFICATION 12 [Aegilops tauschii subsp. strangulata]